MDIQIHTGCDDDFEEDMSIKSEWIKQSRGYTDKTDLQKIHAGALEQVRIARINRYVMRDPGLGKLTDKVEITARRKGIRASEIANVKPDDSTRSAKSAFSERKP